MKTLKRSLKASSTLAVLSVINPQAGNCSVAFLAAELAPNSDGLVQLLPAGEFSAVDGRPQDVKSGKWLMDEIAFANIKAFTPHQQGDLVIDYEHQTLKAEKNGKPAPAAGFFHIDDVQFIPSKGLFFKPRWNEDGQAALAGKKYRYISAVFGYDRETGRPIYLHSAGLTNRPGLDGMQPLADLAAQQISTQLQQEDNAVNEILLAILKALGIKVDGDLPTDQTALSALQTQVNTALAALQSEADKVPTLTTEMAALKAGGGNSNPDPSKFVPVAALTEMQTQLATLQAQVTGGQVSNLVKQGMDDGKILPAMEQWATALGNKDIAELKAYLDNAPALAALKGNQTGGNNPGDEHQDSNHSIEDLEMAKILDVSKEDLDKFGG